MSYYRELRDFILELKGDVAFLSPRERWFLKLLEDRGYPLEVVKQGIKEFYKALRKERRATTPLFLSFPYIERVQSRYSRKKPREVRIDWKSRFREILEKVKDLIPQDFKNLDPSTEEEAESILRDLEKRLLKRLWDNLPEEQKREILKKYAPFRGNEDFFKMLIKTELFRLYNIPQMSIYVS